MEITVKTIKGELKKMCTYYLSQDSKLADLKDKIKMDESIESDNTSIVSIFKGSVLEDDNKLLCDYDIANKSVVVMILKQLNSCSSPSFSSISDITNSSDRDFDNDDQDNEIIFEMPDNVINNYIGGTQLRMQVLTQNPEVIRQPQGQIAQNPDIIQQMRKQLLQNPEIMQQVQEQFAQNPDMIRQAQEQFAQNPDMMRIVIQNPEMIRQIQVNLLRNPAMVQTMQEQLAHNPKIKQKM